MTDQYPRCTRGGSKVFLVRIRRLTFWTLAGVAFFFVAQFVLEPRFEGKRISVWFDELCTGVWSGSPEGERFGKAYEAFGRMDNPRVVAFLVGKVGFDRAGLMQKVIEAGLNQPLTAEAFKRIVLPEERRAYAAVALGVMGKQARGAVPELLRNYEKELSQKVRINLITALAAILGIPHEMQYTALEWREHEKKVLGIAEAVRVNPEKTSID
jgi:hypothetical protein